MTVATALITLVVLSGWIVNGCSQRVSITVPKVTTCGESGSGIARGSPLWRNSICTVPGLACSGSVKLMKNESRTDVYELGFSKIGGSVLEPANVTNSDQSAFFGLPTASWYCSTTW